MNTFTLTKLGKILLPLLMLVGLVLPANASAVATAAVLQVESKPVESNLYFESNVGQMDAQVKFLGSGEGYRLYLMENELRLAMSSENESSAIGIRFPGSNPNPSILPALPLDGKSHFYRGNDSAFWVEDVAHYGEVTYNERLSRHRSGPPPSQR